MAGRSKHDTRRVRKMPEYDIWSSMLQRCGNPNNKDFSHYGERGIKVCERWQSFENFIADMGNKPIGMTIDRRDNNGNYELDNCRWITMKEQCRNRRSTRFITVSGVTMTLTEASEKYGIIYPTLVQRINLGWSAERAVKTPPAKIGRRYKRTTKGSIPRR